MSPRFILDQLDWKKIGKGALVAVGGAALTYAVQVFGNIDWGNYAPIAVAISSVLVNVARKWLADNQQ